MATSKAPTPESNNSQLRFFQFLATFLTTLLVLGAVYYEYKQRSVDPVTILVAGQPVCVASNSATANSLIEAVRLTKAGAAYGDAASPQIVETTVLERAAPNAQVDTDDTAKAKLSLALHVTVDAGVILVDGKPVVALPSMSLANEALQSVEDHYADMPPSDPIDTEPSFREKVTVVDKRVPSEMACGSVADAVTLLVTAPKPKVYVIKPGDTGLVIAHRNHMSLTKFLEANSGVDMTRLHVGDEVNVGQTTPPVSVLLTKRSDKEEAIRDGAPSSSAGKRRLTVITSYLNGEPYGQQQTLSIETIQRAQPAESLM